MTPPRWLDGRFLGLLGLCAAFSPATRAQSGNFQFSAAAYSVKESAATAKIVVTRTGGSAGTVTVDFSTTDGTAQAGTDYVATNGTLTFGPGVTSRFFYVPIVNDSAHESRETVTLDILAVSGPGMRGNPRQATLTITDNDACSYAVSPTSRTADESPGLATFSVIAPEGCSWVAAASAGWIGIFDQGPGGGNGDVTYSYDALPDGVASRTATIQVAGKTFTLTQIKPRADLTPPTITFRSPAEGSRQTNSEITVQGRTTDDGEVTLVEFRLENSDGTTDYAPATGTAEWTADVTGLLPGTNTIRIRARDGGDNIQEAARSVNVVEVSPLTLTEVGEGSVAPLANGQFLDVGKGYTVQAKPARGHFFRNWSLNDVEGPAENPLTFEMTPELALQANFVPSPFTNVAGVYNGLCYEDEARQESSGFLSLKLGPLGTFSAKLTAGGRRFSFSGRFDLGGLATNTVGRAPGPVLTVSLALDLAGGTDSIGGSVSNGTWSASLLTYRDAFDRSHPAPQAGRYTVIIPGDDEDAEAEPGGDGYGTVVVGTDGTAKLSATLADGTKLTQKAFLSKDGWWPLYVPLYAGQGAAVCWVIFNDDVEDDFTGAFTWIKPAIATAKFYPAGFGVQPTLLGSRYHAPTNDTERVIGLSDGHVGFSAGNLTEDFENPLTVAAAGKITNLGSNKLVLTIQKSSGLFTGSVTPPGAVRSIPLRGAVYQKGNYGAGFFLGTNQSGRVFLSE